MSLILTSTSPAIPETGGRNTLLTAQERQEIQELETISKNMVEQIHRRIVGLEEIIEQILICVFSGGHALLVGVPGLAKTLTIRSVAELLDLRFSRIQFTPDLMPSDITGTEILVQEETQNMRQFTFLRGPIFANIILADEINRTPPKTQSALLEAMEENTVTSMGQRCVLDKPFFVLATQNPIEQEGTYPLPVAQLDRFMFNLLLDYPSYQEEYRIMRLTISQAPKPLTSCLPKEKILHFLRLVRKIYIAPEVSDYAVALCRMSRPHADCSKLVKEYVAWGVSPRAAQCLIVGGKARAMLQGRDSVSPADIRAIAHPVMRHRLLLNYQAEADDFTPDELVDHLLETLPSPDGVTVARPRHKHLARMYLTAPTQS
jgi:MoxR-like ATPase